MTKYRLRKENFFGGLKFFGSAEGKGSSLNERKSYYYLFDLLLLFSTTYILYDIFKLIKIDIPETIILVVYLIGAITYSITEALERLNKNIVGAFIDYGDYRKFYTYLIWGVALFILSLIVFGMDGYNIPSNDKLLSISMIFTEVIVIYGIFLPSIAELVGAVPASIINSIIYVIFINVMYGITPMFSLFLVILLSLLTLRWRATAPVIISQIMVGLM